MPAGGTDPVIPTAADCAEVAGQWLQPIGSAFFAVSTVNLRKKESETMVRFRSRMTLIVCSLAMLFVSAGAKESRAAASTAPSMPESAPAKLTLEQCISLALENNPGLQAEREKVLELENDYRIAASGLYPKLSISAYYNRLDEDRLSVSPGMIYGAETQALAKLRQLLFDGGKTRYGSRAASKGADAERQTAEAARLDTVFLVSQAYYRVLESREIANVGETSRAQREAFFKLTEAFRRAGKATRLESLKAEAQLFDADRSLAQAREAHRLSELILKKTIGINLGKAIEIADALPDAFPVPDDEELMIQGALANSPDLKKTALLKEQAEASLRSAYGPFLPELSLQGSYGYRDRDTSPWTDEWTAGVFLEWSLFEGGLTRAQVGKARSKVNQVAWNERGVRDQVQVDLREALGNLRTAVAAIRSSKRLVEAQDEAYKAAVAFYKRGKSTYIEVLSAQVDLTQAKAAYIRAVGDYQNASARLDRVMGKGKSYETENR
jgi:outer membrane protein